MRLLHFRDDHVSHRATSEKSSSAGKRDRRFYGRQCLPLRNVSPHRRCHPEGFADGPARGRERSQSMSAPLEAHVSLEPERYELRAAAPYRFDLDRRDFFKFHGAGLVVASVLKPALVAQESGGGRPHRGESLPAEINAWLHIGDSGKVTVYTGKVEVGQNIRTSLTQAVAEELHVPLTSIEMVMGDTQLTPFDMGTFGSRTTPTMNLQLRKVAAAAREMLLDLAAAKWGVNRNGLTAANGKITDSGTKRSVDYASLTKGQQLTQTVGPDTALIPATNWRVAGESAPKVDGRDFVTGKHRYPSDQKQPDMLYGKIVRPAT